MLVGSMALVHYANPRSTVDIEIVINIMPEDIDRFIAEFEQEYYIPEGAAKKAILNKAMFNLLNNRTILKIDCVVLKESEYDLNAFSRRKKVNYAGDFDVWIISKEDLILSKLLWAKKSGSERQLLDVAGIIRNGFDKVYVDAWAKELELADFLAESFELLERNHVD
ncbi:MAG: DUF6036 family nucleotidyltransferase [Pyrinomonadaceae bacterium]